MVVVQMNETSRQIMKIWLSIPRWVKQGFLLSVTLYVILKVLVEGVSTLMDVENFGSLGWTNFLLCLAASLLIFLILNKSRNGVKK